MRPFNLADLSRLIANLRADLQREANQSILKRDHSQGMAALGGLDALERLENRIASIYPQYRFPAKKEEHTGQSKVRTLRGKMR